MWKTNGLLNEQSSNIFLSYGSTLNSEPYEKIEWDQGNSNSILANLNALENNLIANNNNQSQETQNKTQIDQKDLSIFNLIAIYSDQNFKEFNNHHDKINQIIGQTYYFQSQSHQKSEIFQTLLEVYNNYLQNKDQLYILSQNISILFQDQFCLVGTKNKSIQKHLERLQIQFQSFHKKFDLDIKEDSNTITTDNEELFLIKYKDIQIFFEFILNEIFNEVNFQIISKKEFFLGRKSTFRISKNSTYQLNFNSDQKLKQLAKNRKVQQYEFVQNDGQQLYNICLECYLNVNQVNEIQDYFSNIFRDSFHMTNEKLETTQFFSQKLHI